MRPTARVVCRAFETLGSFTLTAACIVRAGSGHDLQLPENQDALVLRRSRESRGSRGVRQTGISPFRKRKDYLVEETPRFVSADPDGVGSVPGIARRDDGKGRRGLGIPGQYAERVPACGQEIPGSG